MQWSVTQGDCLELLKSLPSGSVDAVITDPPYATTNCEWDTWAMTPEWWGEIWRVTKPESAVVISICGKALVRLLSEAGQWYRYKTVWDRVGNATGVLDANKRPLRRHEDICVFSNGRMPKYYVHREASGIAKVSGTRKSDLKSDLYHGRKLLARTKPWNDDGLRFPVDIASVPVVGKTGGGKFHPTQKPVSLIERFSLQHTKEGETVLDPFCGSGTTGVACVQTGRNFIGYEIDAKYCEIARRRIEAAVPLFAEATNA